MEENKNKETSQNFKTVTNPDSYKEVYKKEKNANL